MQASSKEGQIASVFGPKLILKNSSAQVCSPSRLLVCRVSATVGPKVARMSGLHVD